MNTNLIDSGTEIAPFVYMFENVIDNCDELILAAKEKAKLEKINEASIYSKENKNVVDKTVRDTQRIEISPTYRNHVRWWILAQKIWQYANDYANYYDVMFSSMEFPQFLHYKKNKGFYVAHVDDGPSSRRILSSVLYLNDVAEGGETYFEKFDLSVKPKAGRLILFPSNFVYIHGAKKPISNDKFAVVTWFNP